MATILIYDINYSRTKSLFAVCKNSVTLIFIFISNFNSYFFRQMLDCSCIFNSLFIYQTFKIQFLNYIHLINSANVYIWFHMFVCNFIFLEKIWLIKMRTIPLYNNSKNNIGNPITDFLRWFLSYYSRFSFWKTLF